ncbi:MAG: hypothetical protein HRU11_14640, partial [Parvularculaceae bacterium]|nr:hypothetical protein [Parvularculaceae bacterium]
MTLGTVIDTWRWVSYDRALRKAPRLLDQPIRVCFTPQEAGPWYFSRAIVEMLGAQVVARPQDADLIWVFDDATYTDVFDAPRGTIALNDTCTDVSKTEVARISKRVFGSDLSVDPSSYIGPMVEKSEINGAHDGCIVHGPFAPRTGSVYQRLIDNRIEGGLVEDLRTTIMGGKPVLVFRKRRPVDDRFANSNAEVILTDLDEAFSTEEQRQIAQFADEIGLDAGGLDVLRDAETGQLAIVDANKTDMGPPMALPLSDKLTATRTMALALQSY